MTTSLTKLSTAKRCIVSIAAVGIILLGASAFGPRAQAQSAGTSSDQLRTLQIQVAQLLEIVQALQLQVQALNNRSTGPNTTASVSGSTNQSTQVISPDILVQTTEALKVRAAAGTTGTLLSVQEPFSQGRIVEGPHTADGYTWWRVDFGEGQVGWSAANWLRDITNATAQNSRDQVVTADNTTPAVNVDEAKSLSAYVLQMAVGLRPENLKYDVNNSGRVTANDALEISRIAAGLNPQGQVNVSETKKLINEWREQRGQPLLENEEQNELIEMVENIIAQIKDDPDAVNPTVPEMAEQANQLLRQIEDREVRLDLRDQLESAVADAVRETTTDTTNSLAEYVLEMAVGLRPADLKYDVNQSGSVTAGDALEINRVEVGLTPQAPASTAGIQNLIDEWKKENGFTF